MSGYYLGGYYLLKLRPVNFGTGNSKTIYTCSNCINDSLVDNWSYSWVYQNNSAIKSVYNAFKIDGQKVLSIRDWVDKKMDTKNIGCGNVFSDLETAKIYKQTFFSHLDEIVIMSIYFSQKNRTDLLHEFTPQNEGQGSIALYDNLIKNLSEDKFPNEKHIGFDLVGVELTGDLHTFYCHDLSENLINKFGVAINSFGLLNEENNWTPIIDYMNDKQTGLEPVPWFLVKIKLVNKF